MTKEELLKSYLSDEIVKEKNYLKGNSFEKVKWSDPDTSDLVTVIKLAIDGNYINESDSITMRKINKHLNSLK